MMKVGYILRKFPVLSETFILNEILELEKRGLQIEIFSIERPNDSRFHPDLGRLNAEVHYVPDLLNWKALLKYRKEAKKYFCNGYRKGWKYIVSHFNPVLLLRFLQSCYVVDQARKLGIRYFHSHFATRSTSVAFFASMIMECPYSFTAHAVDIFKESLSKETLLKKMEQALHIVTVSEFNKHYLTTLGPMHGQKIVKIHNGIDLQRFRPCSDPLPELFTFLCVARMVEKKGHRILIEACRFLKEWGVEYRCLVVGKGKLQGEIDKKIKEWDLVEQVKLMGPKTHEAVLHQYHRSHAFILPCVEGVDGNKDGLPVSIVEALACGLPVITTPMTGNPEVVRNGVNGLLVPFGDSISTAEAMRRLVLDADLYHSLKKEARLSVLDRFDQIKTVSSLAALFENGERE